MTDNLSFLSDFFQNQCDGEWESDFGINIESVNNPGWMVRISLDGTGLNPDDFKPLAIQRTDADWVECKVEDGVWLGGCGAGNLDEVLGVFRAFVERSPRTQDREPQVGQRGSGGGGAEGGGRPGPRFGGGRGGPRPGGGGGGKKPWGKPRGGPRRG